jgi:hypothetical protein
MNGRNESTMLDEIQVPDKMNVFQRIGCLLFSPSKLFLYIKQKPTILFPIILISVFAIAAQVLTWEQVKGVQLDAVYNTYKSMGLNYTPDQLESMLELTKYFSFAAAPFVYLGTWAIASVILYLIYRLVKCEKGLKKYFSMTGYIMILTMVGMVINSAYVYLTGSGLSTAMVTSAASLLDPALQGTFLHGLASNIEVFNLWAFILFGMGFVYTGGVEKKKSFALTAILAVIVILASSGLSILLAGLQNSMLQNFGG